MTPRYQTLSRIAETGFSTVDHVLDRETGREAALKRPRLGNAEALKQLETEAAVLSGLRHDHIVKLLGGGADEHGRYLAFEWIEGPSLDSVIHQRPAGDDQLGRLLPPLLRALIAVHAAGWCHADLSASNILIHATSGAPALIDFGNASALEDDRPRNLEDANIGSIHHMAPELFAGRPPSVRSDLYALGVIAFHALTGRYPFEGSSKAQIITAHLRQPRPLLPHSILGPWIHGLLSRDPAARPVSAEAALLALPVDSGRWRDDQ